MSYFSATAHCVWPARKSLIWLSVHGTVTCTPPEPIDRRAMVGPCIPFISMLCAFSGKREQPPASTKPIAVLVTAWRHLYLLGDTIHSDPDSASGNKPNSWPLKPIESMTTSTGTISSPRSWSWPQPQLRESANWQSNILKAVTHRKQETPPDPQWFDTSISYCCGIDTKSETSQKELSLLGKVFIILV